MNTIENFEESISEKLPQFLTRLEIAPASTLTFIAKPDRYIDPTKIKLLPFLINQDFGISNKKKFLNCVSLKFQLDKVIICKIFKNGTLQITGCKTKQHPIIICKKIQPLLGCVYIISLAMENVYAELFLNVDKLKLYLKWKLSGKQASPPIGPYTAVRLRIVLNSMIQTTYFSWKGKTFALSSFEDRQSTVNVALFNNGKILFSGINRNVITTAATQLIQFLNCNKDVFIQTVNAFC